MPFYGDARKSGLTNFAALAQTYNGYWLVTSTGKVYTYGSVCQGDKISAPKKVVSPIIGTLYLSPGLVDEEQQRRHWVPDGQRQRDGVRHFFGS